MSIRPSVLGGIQSVLALKVKTTGCQQQIHYLHMKLGSGYSYRHKYPMFIDLEHFISVGTSSWEYTALPGVLRFIDLEGVCSSGKANFNATLLWIDGNFKAFSHFLSKDIVVCNKNTRQLFPLKECFNISQSSSASNWDEEHHVLFMDKVFYEALKKDFIFPGDTNMLMDCWYKALPNQDTSWQEASQMCSRMLGTLPTFSSQNQMEQLVTMFKLSHDIPPAEALFIGLKAHHMKQVHQYSADLDALEPFYSSPEVFSQPVPIENLDKAPLYPHLLENENQNEKGCHKMHPGLNNHNHVYCVLTLQWKWDKVGGPGT